MAEVPLVDLEVIVRYSLAIRQEMAPAEEVLAALDESRAFVVALMERSASKRVERPRPAPEPEPEPEVEDENLAFTPPPREELRPRMGGTSTRHRHEVVAEEVAPAPSSSSFDPEWSEEVERIRQRRMRKAQMEAEERQARQAPPIAAAPPPDPAGPTPLSAEEAARRRAERRRRRQAAGDPWG